jgi:PadR family transcriptional regulator, regulatory protein PadR
VERGFCDSYAISSRLSKPRPIDNNVYYNHNVLLIMLGEFEYLVLAATARLGADAYGAAIRLEIENSTRRSCSIGALYTTLDRLEEKGLIETWMGSATRQRGGRSKRMVRVTARGIKAATEFYGAVKRSSSGVPWEANRAGGRP